MSHVRMIAALLALAAAAFPAGAFAQSSPADAPSYSRPSYASDEETVRGRITAFDGGYNLQVRDDRGFIDSVRLAQGTIINPTGISLRPGMSVTVMGVNRGSFLAANEIDTPYRTYGAVPVYPAYGYAYPVYAYPYPGPAVSLNFGFGPYHHGWH